MSYARFRRVQLAYELGDGGMELKVTHESDCIVDAENVAVASQETDGSEFVALELKHRAVCFEPGFGDTCAITVRGTLSEVAERLDAARRRGK